MTDANYDDDADDRTVVSCWLEGCQHPMPDTFQSTFAFTRALLHYQVDHHLYSSHFFLTQMLLLDQLVYQPILNIFSDMISYVSSRPSFSFALEHFSGPRRSHSI